MAGLGDRIREIAREEASSVVSTRTAAIESSRSSGGATLGVITAIDTSFGTVTVILANGQTVIANVSGNRAISVGAVVPLVGSVII